MKLYESVEALAEDVGVPLFVVKEQHEAHYQAVKKTEKDPDGGSWSAHPPGKLWDEVSGKTSLGKE